MPPCHPDISYVAPDDDVSGPFESITPGRATLREFLTLYAQFRCVPAGDFTTVYPVEEALLPATGQAWAMASFTLSRDAPFWLAVDSQDGGRLGVFAMTASGHWEVVGIPHAPVGCTTLIPVAIRQLWNMVCPE